jgi:hypothetical protein
MMDTTQRWEFFIQQGTKNELPQWIDFFSIRSAEQDERSIRNEQIFSLISQ